MLWIMTRVKQGNAPLVSTLGKELDNYNYPHHKRRKKNGWIYIN